MNASQKKPILEYNGMKFLFHGKPNNEGFYYTHIASGHGVFNNILAKTFGKPNKKNAINILTQYIESSEVRAEIIKQYKEKYGN